MNNKARLRAENTTEVLHMINVIRKMPNGNNVDWERWLSSESEAPVYKGTPGIYTNDRNVERQCVIIGERTVLGKRYLQIIDEDNGFRTVKPSAVRKCNE